MNDLTAPDKNLLEQPIVQHLLKAERGVTYSQLAVLFSPDESKTRLADKTIQKCRRRGWIAFKREGGFVLWRPTDAGRALGQRPSTEESGTQ